MAKIWSASIAEAVAKIYRLTDDFSHRQIALETHRPGGTETTSQRASDLRAQADDKLLFSGPIHQRYPHRLERFGPVAPEKILGESVPRRLIRERKLSVYRYRGFWQQVDTFREKILYDRMEGRGDCPWMVWKKR